LKPNDIKSEIGSALVDAAKQEHKIPITKEATFKQQKSNSESYKGDLQVGDYVYKQFDAKLFDKSFDVSVRFHFTQYSLIYLRIKGRDF